MKVVLTEDIYKKGVAGEVVDVADGYARNYLIPYGMAVKATAGAFKQLAALRQHATIRRDQRDHELSALAEQLEALTLSFPVKAGETGKLYGSVTNGQMGEAIQAEINTEIDRRRIGEKPLRELGEHSVVVRLSSGLTVNVRVLIHREGEEPESVIGVTPDAGDIADFEEDEAFDAEFFEDDYAEDDEETVADAEAEEADVDADSDESETLADMTGDDESSEADALDDTEAE